ncbi:MAG: hypothetical protein ACYS99_21485 [Planctomycetota bacterium]|jgi:hypothetical protein
MSRTHCSHCGAEVPRDKPACPECGSDAETGWAGEEAQSEAAFAPFTDEDYEEVVRDLAGGDDGPSRSWIVVAIAVLTLALFALTYVL